MTQFFSTYNKTNVNRVQKGKWQNKKKQEGPKGPRSLT